MFLEHKTEENAKDLIFHARTVFDGVKRKNLTASRVNIMTTQYKHEGVTSRASRVKSVTACKRDNMTASDVDQGSPRIILAVR